MTDTRRGLLLMLLASALFSGMALCVGLAHKLEPDLPSVVASLWRSGVNLGLLFVLARGNLRLLVGDGRLALWLRGLAGAAALITYFVAIPRAGLGEAAFLNQTSALWVALLGPMALGEPTDRRVWLAVAVGLGGLGLMTDPHPGADLGGLGFGAFSGLMAALAYLAVRRAGTSNRPITLVFYFTVMATLASVVLSWGLPGPRLPATMGLLFASGVFATVAQLAMTRAYQLAPAAPTAATAVASPLLSALLGWLVLSQTPAPRGLVGMALVLVASVILPFSASRRARQTT